jgi:hypothetical protein
VKSTSPWFVDIVSGPLTAPGEVGEKEIGTSTAPPADSVVGSTPAVFVLKGASADALLTVTVADAVRWMTALAVVLTGTSPKLTGDAERTVVDGRPNAIRWPSRVPT